MVCGWQILQRRSWWWYPVFGVLAGFSYLSKPSFEPFLVVFAASLGLRLILDGDLAAVPAAAAGSLAAILLMGAMVTPLFLYKKEHFGAATFGYPKYWMWMDDFETEAWPWQDRYPGRVQLEMLPAAETPSARWYFQRHSAGDAMARLATGSKEVFWRFFFPERKRLGAFVWKTQEIKKWGQPLSHRGVYLLTILALAAMLAAESWKVVCPNSSGRAMLRAWQWLPVPPRSICCFTAGIIPSAAGTVSWEACGFRPSSLVVFFAVGVWKFRRPV